jgi:hypothetical protein
MQQGMLLETLADSQQHAYFVQINTPLEGEVDSGLMVAAWNQVVAAHPELRTAFYWRELSEPHQAVFERVDLPFLVEDWRDLDRATQQTRLDTYLAEDRARGFALDQPPLMRLALFRTAAQAYHLVWSNHHLLLDGWCRPIIMEEVLAAYRAGMRGETHQPTPRPPFRDYIAWLRQRDPGRAEAFWRQRLDGFRVPGPLMLDAVKPRGEARFAHYHTTWSQELHQAARQFCGRQHLTINTLIQGGWALLLARCLARDDVAFGATVSGRPTALPHGDRMLGMFINTLPVRAHLAADQACGAWLRAFQEEQLAGREFEYTPLAQILAMVGADRRRGLFETILVFNNYPLDHSLTEPGAGFRWRAESVSWSNTYAHYPLIVVIDPSRTPRFNVVYNTARFSQAAIEDHFRNFNRMLETMLAQPDTPLGDFYRPKAPKPITRDDEDDFQFD